MRGPGPACSPTSPRSLVSRSLNFRQLEAFRAVMLTGSITGAAHSLCISQPAVSRLIKDLEYELKLSLFARQGTHLVPTEEGRELYREVERHFSGTERILEAARALRLSKAGYLHVGIMPNLAMVCMPKAVSQMIRRYPGLVISVHPDSSVNLVQMIVHRQLDVAFAVPPADPRGLSRIEFPATTAICVMPKGHRLAAKRRVSVRDLHGEDFISLGSSSVQRIQINAAMLEAGVRPNVQLETVHSASVISYVSQGVGLAVIDPIAAMGPALDLVTIRPFTPTITMPISAIYRTETKTQSRFATEFTELLGSVIAEELANIDKLIASDR
jgi:DNA-binding transcriptional LysR family regulator